MLFDHSQPSVSDCTNKHPIEEVSAQDEQNLHEGDDQQEQYTPRLTNLADLAELNKKLMENHNDLEAGRIEEEHKESGKVSLSEVNYAIIDELELAEVSHEL